MNLKCSCCDGNYCAHICYIKHLSCCTAYSIKHYICHYYNVVYREVQGLENYAIRVAINRKVPRRDIKIYVALFLTIRNKKFLRLENKKQTWKADRYFIKKVRYID